MLLEIEQPESGVLDTIKFPAKIGKGANEKTIQGVANFGEGHYFPATVSTIDFSAFDKDANAIVIGERAFYNDDQISTIIFTDQYGGVFHGVSMIDKEAFAGCDGLATLKLPKGIVIHEKAFYSCSYMYNLDLSDWDHNFITSKIETSQYSIGLNAFAGFRSDG
ncbi:MAG: leucine-rich repeat domain-containing protein [Mycoplasmoidaceae bacterium]|nr:leucine-rich repeat domain-containing protein [Mycoplasmoidaceae bacterium]